MVEKLKNEIDVKLLKQSFLVTVIWGLITHGYRFASLFVSHDSLNDFYLARQWPKAGFGRFYYAIYITLARGRIVLPWLIGVFALCWTAIAVYLIVRMLEVKKSGIVVLIAGICVTNPTVYALAATYIQDLDVDMFALLLAVTAAFLWNIGRKARERKMQCGLLVIGAFILSVALGLYQSYISTTIALIIFISVKNLLNEDDTVNVLLQGIYGVVMLVVSAVFYLAEAKIFESLTGSNVLNNQSYNGLGNLSQILSGDILGQIGATYQNFAAALKNLIITSYPEKLCLVIQGILAVCVIVIIVCGLKQISWKSRFLTVLLGIVLPFGMNVSYFLSNGVGHVLTKYAVWLLYLFALILVLAFEKWKSVSNTIKKVLGTLVLVCVFATLMENVQTANAIYVKKELEYQSTLSYMTRIAERIEELEDYVPGETPVVIIGEDVIGKERKGFERYSKITGVGADSPLTFYDTYEDYFEYVLGLDIKLKDVEIIEDDDTVQKMPVFPKQGSVSMIDGAVVVKLKEN